MCEKSRLVDLNIKVPFDVKQVLYKIANELTKEEGKRISIAYVAREMLQKGLKCIKK